jgi:hypothetical protein
MLGYGVGYGLSLPSERSIRFQPRAVLHRDDDLIHHLAAIKLCRIEREPELVGHQERDAGCFALLGVKSTVTMEVTGTRLVTVVVPLVSEYSHVGQLDV